MWRWVEARKAHVFNLDCSDPGERPDAPRLELRELPDHSWQRTCVCGGGTVVMAVDGCRDLEDAKRRALAMCRSCPDLDPAYAQNIDRNLCR
jgi:hypothetical protein